MPAEQATELRAIATGLTVKYLEYDWRLNEMPKEEGGLQ